MGEQHPYRATIPAVSDESSRPLWSVMIPTYNSGRYLRESLASVLAQDLGPDAMQIEVVDDHSTQDDPAAVVEELGGGRVGFYRQRENVGQVRNYETCLKRSRGKLVHMLQDDDYVRDGFYRKMQRAFEDNPEIGMAFCRNIYMDPEGHWLTLGALERRESGILADWLERIASGQRVGNPAVVVRREVYEKLGGFDRRLGGGEDWEMWVRIAAHYPVWFEVEPLTAYRVRRPGSVTQSSVRTGKVVRAMCRATEVIESYLPEHLPKNTVKNVSKQARSLYLRWAIRGALRMLESRDPRAAFTYMWLAIKCSYSAAYGLAFPVTFNLIRSKIRLWYG